MIVFVTGLVTANGNSRAANCENTKRIHGLTLRLWPIPKITERTKNLTGKSPPCRKSKGDVESGLINSVISRDDIWPINES